MPVFCPGCATTALGGAVVTTGAFSATFGGGVFSPPHPAAPSATVNPRTLPRAPKTGDRRIFTSASLWCHRQRRRLAVGRRRRHDPGSPLQELAVGVHEVAA